MGFQKKPPIWTPGCGRPHPEIELIKAWAEGKIEYIDKQRINDQGKPYGAPVKVQYPCWNPEGWVFDVAHNSQMSLDLGVPVKKKKNPLPMASHDDLSRDIYGLALG